MPYNTTAIPPRKEATGQTQLPLSKVKKIIAFDPDISQCSNNAAFVMTIAAELFVQYLANEGQLMTRSERKPRRNLQYKDLAKAVQHNDELEFLSDVIPETAPMRKVRAKAAETQAKLRGEGGEGGEGEKPNGKRRKLSVNGAGPSAAGGQRPGTSSGGGVNGLLDGAPGPRPGTAGSGVRALVDEDPSAQLEMEMRAARGPRGGDVEMED